MSTSICQDDKLAASFSVAWLTVTQSYINFSLYCPLSCTVFSSFAFF